MSTTNLFVELVVIGVGAFTWVCLLLLAIFGVDAAFLKELINTPAATVPALSAIYLLGIVTDRLADGLFHLARMETKHRESYAEGKEQYFRDRAFVLANSQQFAQLYEYSRSRQRICRGWAFNAVAILVSLDLFLLMRHSNVHNWGVVALVTSCFLAALAIACWLSWEAMTDTELKRIKEQANALAPNNKLRALGG
jgi:hypothetical protein